MVASWLVRVVYSADEPTVTHPPHPPLPETKDPLFQTRLGILTVNLTVIDKLSEGPISGESFVKSGWFDTKVAFFFSVG